MCWVGDLCLSVWGYDPPRSPRDASTVRPLRGRAMWRGWSQRLGRGGPAGALWCRLPGAVEEVMR